MQRSDSFMTRIMEKIGLLDVGRIEELPSIDDMEAAPLRATPPVEHSLDDVKIETPPEAADTRYSFDRLTDLHIYAPASKATKLYQSTKAIHQQLIEKKESLLTALKSQRKIDRGLLIFILGGTVSLAVVISVLIATGYLDVTANEKFKHDHDVAEAKRVHQEVIAGLQRLFVNQTEETLFHYKDSERDRVRKLLFSDSAYASYAWYISWRMPPLDTIKNVAADLAYPEDRKWFDTASHPPCRMESGLYSDPYAIFRYKYCPDGWNYTLPDHPILFCYELAKSMCDLQNLNWQKTDFARQVDSDYFNALAIRHKLTAEMQFIETTFETSASVFIAISVIAGLAILGGLIAMIGCHFRAEKQYDQDVSRTETIEAGYYLDDEKKQALADIASELPSAVTKDTPTNTMLETLKQTGRLLNPQRYVQSMLFRKPFAFGGLPTDVHGEITSHLYEKPDPSKDMPLLDWIKK